MINNNINTNNNIIHLSNCRSITLDKDGKCNCQIDVITRKIKIQMEFRVSVDESHKLANIAEENPEYTIYEILLEFFNTATEIKI